MDHDIHVLDQSTIDKIAAGEVVERPASVVKELTENAIDAGADRITVEIKDGGISLIRISDNGKGIAPEDLPLAFLRHATSKITTVQDLSSLNSLGFRGEALSSIAAVSRVEMITKRSDDLSATRYVIEGGKEKLREEIGAPDGTTILVRDIFYNTPARAKFLKTALTEAAHVGSFVEQLILSNPDIAFQFVVNGQTKLTSPGNGNLKDAIYHIYGKEIVSELVAIDKKEDGVSIKGFIAKPAVSRGNRNYENYYVNGRYVRSRIISRAVEDGYTTKMMQHQYPFTCLFIEMTGSSVDVNVHPSKMEVRFSDEKRMYDILSACIKEALDKEDMILKSSLNTPDKPEAKLRAEEEKRTPRIEPFEARAASLVKDGQGAYGDRNLAGSDSVSFPPFGAGAGGENQGFRVPVELGTVPAEPETAGTEHAGTGGKVSYGDGSGSPAQAGQAGQAQIEADAADQAQKAQGGVYEQQSFLPRFLSQEASPLRRIVGQVFSTYWIFEYQDKMYIMDQHAAHERILFERFMKNYHTRKLSSQQISPPMILTLNSQEEQLLHTYQDAFTSLGFEIEAFGGRDFAIRAVPYDLGAIDSEDLFLSLLNQLEYSTSMEDLDIYIHRVATEACKAAVKGGGRLSVEEAQSLIDQLFDCEDPYHCPHGRPTIISIPRTDLEKRFKRIVS